MTLYAASNLVAATVPVESGGCGTEHRRPVINGAPQHPWGLDCPLCEDFLRTRNPDQWSVTLSEIPETHDEKKAREDFEKRGALDERKLMAMALAKLTGIEIPETISGAITGKIHVPGLMECPSGHPNAPGLKFCGECGSPMRGAPAAAAIAPAQKAAQPPPANGRPVRLRDQNKTTLQALCREHGLSGDGTNSELVNRLSAKGVTNNDLARFLERQLAAA